MLFCILAALCTILKIETNLDILSVRLCILKFFCRKSIRKDFFGQGEH